MTILIQHVWHSCGHHGGPPTLSVPGRTGGTVVVFMVSRQFSPSRAAQGVPPTLSVPGRTGRTAVAIKVSRQPPPSRATRVAQLWPSRCPTATYKSPKSLHQLEILHVQGVLIAVNQSSRD